jgi:hypothetical protein
VKRFTGWLRRKLRRGVLVLLANLAVLALTVKLYTEYFKDRALHRARS